MQSLKILAIVALVVAAIKAIIV
uniref:Truncated vpu protein n=2 Tax=Human immunodeficiency virus type 1 TaxID=11676 RepID=Q98ZR2_HV1|nr:truncated vpu protein [Human immunodeficiency virus 1]